MDDVSEKVVAAAEAQCGMHWAHMSFAEKALALVAVGADPLAEGLLEWVPPDYSGACAVWQAPEYYQGTYNAPLPRFWNGSGFAEPTAVEVFGETVEVAIFASAADAREAIRQWWDTTAGGRLNHGEFASPLMTPVRWES